MASIGIVGGGVVGLCAGIELLDAGRQVAIVDDDAAGASASWGNAGHIAVEQVEPLASMSMVRSLPQRLFLRGGPLAFPPSALAQWVPFGLRLLSAARPANFRKGCEALAPLLAGSMPAWVATAERIGAPDLLRQDGHFVVWQDARAAREGHASWQTSETGSAEVHAATEAELALLSGLTDRPAAGAIRFSGSGQIADLEELRQALRKAFTDRGGILVAQRGELRLAGQRVEIGGVDADQVLVCAGVRSRELMEYLGHKVPMIAERGYHVRADASRWPADLPPVVFEERSMIVTRYRGAVQAASFVELGKVDAPADPRKWERLERHVSELGLPIEGPFRRWMGCRPTLPDYLPAIGRSTKASNLFYAFGHQHLGLTLAPITARLVTAMVAGGQPELPLAPFDIQRFA
ncbi:D-amino-acid dehydrogenase [Novosphingobium sp. PhB55]|uniref:NAD(P)/FAD-dependent oxidoreductase n=1 Tax=Novosphingobium sp. PhB55 TaxID=2485106 RepID=UPI00106665F2|nr:FAD-binding oxidoreductase [Novosphingobium sp. PhB55]TDW61767.1 D-amino-acid dehydrogenase [Novosphingobium sp. PhB55]